MALLVIALILMIVAVACFTIVGVRQQTRMAAAKRERAEIAETHGRARLSARLQFDNGNHLRRI